jgi:hypothetical protein
MLALLRSGRKKHAPPGSRRIAVYNRLIIKLLKWFIASSVGPVETGPRIPGTASLMARNNY